MSRVRSSIVGAHRAVAGLATGVLAVGLLSGTAAHAAPSPHPPVWDHGAGGERYVAFGDSFVSGPGIQPQRAGGDPACWRSERNFPTVLATALDVRAFTDASCSGGTIEDLWVDQGDNPPQLDALGPDTTLVTFGTLGGNDVDLVNLALQCVLGAEPCTGTDDDTYHQAVEDTRDRLAAGIRETKERAPQALIVAVGYGTYLPPGGCPQTISGLNAEEADYLRAVIDHLSDVIGEVAAAEGVLFADQRLIPGALDHTACAPLEDQWIRGIYFGDDGSALHPSTAGMAATAAFLQEIIPLEPAPGPDPDPDSPKPEPKPTRAALVAQAKAALKSTRLRARCGTTKAGRRKVVLRVRGGKGLVRKVVFRVGPRKVAVDRTAPWRRQHRAARLKRLAGKPKARVTVRIGEVTRRTTLVVRRPGCLR